MPSRCIPFDHGGEIEPWAEMSAEPRYSVVIPTYNRPERLRSCVAALVGLSYERSSFEVVVVDDGSGANQRVENERVVDAAARDIDIRLVEQDNAGPAAARNRGAREARGRWLAFTDDDCAPDGAWLQAFDRSYADRPDALLGGRIVNGLAGNRCAAASQTLIDFAYGWAQQLGHGAGPDRAWLFATANVSCSRAHFLEVGGFDESFPLAAGEDYEFCHRYQQAGYPAMYTPEAVIHHQHAMNIRQFWRQHFSYGRGSLRFRRRVATRTGRPAQVRFGAFQIGLARYCLRRLDRPDALAHTGLIALSQVATVAGAAVEAVRGR